MNKIKGCIFDLDGVIVDTAKYHYLAWSSLAKELGIAFNEKDNERLKGVSRMESLNIILSLGNKKMTLEEKELLADKKNKKYVECIDKLKEEEILPGVKEFLQELRNEGIKISLGSASKNSRFILDKLALKDYFDCIIDGNKISKAKPDPEVFLAAVREMELSAEECVVFEDALAGVRAAHNGGMKVIGVGSEENLSEADIVIKGFEGISTDILSKL
ncbi:beta-phosphoglucomutase [Clostridium sp. 'White wine YQ']|uniref:beta-phosphoglucomutase n=1 Tax=Clostridium sp. 'White wine YQ' TaxID=3027474 RepID=UPI0023667834|nr:beta-phosphoglucomutase [Clostridium sp. 'White wine YQ']MDD7795277.1 beta-phosphoglucomutase [Clostridium sp. 'White wine YQ']